LILDDEKVIKKEYGQVINDPNLRTLDYNFIEETKKMKDNILMFNMFSLTQQCELLHDAFKPHDAHKNIVVSTESVVSKVMCMRYIRWE
jgi:hypothetical protein